EAVQTGQLVHSAGGTQVVEQAAPAHSLELPWVADERQPPALAVGEFDQAMKRGGADHARLVRDERRADREPVRLKRSPIGPVPFVQQLGDGVCSYACLLFEDTGGLGGGGHS